MLVVIAKKTLMAVIDPRKWGTLYRKALLVVENAIEYGQFSLNPNTKKYWNGRLSEYGTFWRNEHYLHILELFPREKSFSLLDVGCAMGDGCELLQDEFPKARITGIDISDGGIEKAKRRTKCVEYRCLDIFKEPISGKYDYITIIETLEHFDNPFPVVENCLAHVEKALIVSVPYKDPPTLASEHRYTFDENTFADYRCEIVKLIDCVNVSGLACIIYRITP